MCTTTNHLSRNNTINKVEENKAEELMGDDGYEFKDWWRHRDSFELRHLLIAERLPRRAAFKVMWRDQPATACPVLWLGASVHATVLASHAGVGGNRIGMCSI